MLTITASLTGLVFVAPMRAGMVLQEVLECRSAGREQVPAGP